MGQERRAVIPRQSPAAFAKHGHRFLIVDLHGWRGLDASVHYLSPWDFITLWDPVRLPLPKKTAQGLTIWSTAVDSDGLTAEQLYQTIKGDEDPIIPQPGQDYFVNETLLTGPACPWGAINVLVYPNEPELQIFRHELILRRLPRPVVPSPVHTPLPHKKHTPEERSPNSTTDMVFQIPPSDPVARVARVSCTRCNWICVVEVTC